RWPGMPHYPAENGFAKLSAAWLIDQCGWKGRSVGRAGVWHLQPLVLVNLGGAEGNEILELSRKVQDSVREKFGVELSPEVRII
ncbi:MAG: hypothetical protein HUJ91_07745, partial [Bacteroidales bacterium]|nr:hypothetical protein [Bacteroidales bacterium]